MPSCLVTDFDHFGFFLFPFERRKALYSGRIRRRLLSAIRFDPHIVRVVLVLLRARRLRKLPPTARRNNERVAILRNVFFGFRKDKMFISAHDECSCSDFKTAERILPLGTHKLYRALGIFQIPDIG